MVHTYTLNRPLVRVFTLTTNTGSQCPDPQYTAKYIWGQLPVFSVDRFIGHYSLYGINVSVPVIRMHVQF